MQETGCEREEKKAEIMLIFSGKKTVTLARPQKWDYIEPKLYFLNIRSLVL